MTNATEIMNTEMTERDRLKAIESLGKLLSELEGDTSEKFDVGTIVDQYIETKQQRKISEAREKKLGALLITYAEKTADFKPVGHSGRTVTLSPWERVFSVQNEKGKSIPIPTEILVSGARLYGDDLGDFLTLKGMPTKAQREALERQDPDTEARKKFRETVLALTELRGGLSIR